MFSFLKRIFPKKVDKKDLHQKVIDSAFADGLITKEDAEMLEKAVDLL